MTRPMIRARVLDISNGKIEEEIRNIKVDRRALDILSPKGNFYLVKLEDIPSPSANIIKQEMLSLGADVAVARGSIVGKLKRTDCLLMGTKAQYQRLIEKLQMQPLRLAEIGRQIQLVLENYERSRTIIKWKGYKMEFGKRTYIMGILNVTPDSFSDGGKFLDVKDAVDHALRMEEEGADIIDVGGESTRPGAKTVKVKEELRRVIPVIKKLRKKLRVPISIDTRKAKVAEEALEHGADIINDVSGLYYDPKMIEVVKRYDVPVIIMHMKGTPKTMQVNPYYEDVISEIYSYFIKVLQRLEKNGVGDGKVILDPGIGFGKALEHNIEIFRRLREFKSLGRPILIGPSRKSFIGEILDLPVEKRLNGTLASCALAILNGADILRVHDVRPVREVADLLDRMVR